MTDKDILVELLDSIQGVSTAQGSMDSRLARVEKDVAAMVQAIHVGNGKESITTRLAQMENKTNESRARIIKVEEGQRRCTALQSPTTPLMPPTTDAGTSPTLKEKKSFWELHGAKVVPYVIMVLSALTALFSAITVKLANTGAP